MPSYNPQSLCDQLQSDIDQICSIPSGSVIIVAGYFNLLNTTFLEVDCGLTQLVDMRTHCHNILDRIFCNGPDLYSTTVFRSLIKTKHQAVLAYGQVPIATAAPGRSRRSLWYMTDAAIILTVLDMHLVHMIGLTL